jgi:hypothetical protein
MLWPDIPLVFQHPMRVARTLRGGRDGSKQTRLGLGTLDLAHLAPTASVARFGPSRGHDRCAIIRRGRRRRRGRRANQQRPAVPGEQNARVAKQLGVRVLVLVCVVVAIAIIEWARVSA